MAKILVTDDEATDRHWIHTVLSGAGHDVVFAADGGAAIERYRKGDVDVVVTDLVMPNLNGFRLIKALTHLDETVCIVAVTGKSPEHLDLAEEYGALAALTKPLNPDELLEAVQDAAETRRGRGWTWSDREWKPSDWFDA